MFSLEGLLPLLVTISTLISISLLLLPSQYMKDKRNGRKDRIQILVLGDLGRSPRMQYHALSVARHGALVDLIGYQESSLGVQITGNPSIQIHSIPSTPSFLKTKSKGIFLVLGPLKVLFQVFGLFLVLGYRTKPARWLIVQNPPSIPSLMVAQAMSFLRNTRLVIDWHNFGYSILALKLGSRHPLVRISKVYERYFSHIAIINFAVSAAMARILRRDYGLPDTVFALHDRPASHFQPLSADQRLAFLRRHPETTSFAENIELGKARLLVSSTSWTPDEDFGILLDALVQYSDLAMTSHPFLPEILVVVTGKGPLKENFLDQINMLKAQDKLEMITFKTAWLNTEDYASLLGAADLGVSLHQSSSGVDLPMKVVDMFGAGLPVVGWAEFEAWPELVKEGINGRGFKTAAELQAILMRLFGDDGRELQSLREGAIREGSRRWDDEWDPIAGKLLGLCS